MYSIKGSLHHSSNKQGPEGPAGLQGKPGPEHRRLPTPEHLVGDRWSQHDKPACVGSPEFPSLQSHPK